MERLNIFVTTEETERIVKLAQEARETPCIAFSMAHGINEGGLSGQAWKRVHEEIYKCALAHGLPEITGYYGLDGSNGEFLKT